jgi:hypothetical protein
MEQALEALEQFSGLTKAKGLADVADAAFTALRAALAEAEVDYKPLTDPHDHPEPWEYKWTLQEMNYINRRVAAAIAAHEAKRGEA